MPYIYRIDAEVGVLFVTTEGTVTQAERIDAMRSWQSHPDYRPGLNTLCDFTGATSVPSMEEIKELVGLMQRQADVIGRKKLAIITARPITFGAARQFQTLLGSGPIEARPFTEREAAWAWLTET